MLLLEHCSNWVNAVITSAQLRAARALLGKSQPEIAEIAKVSSMTVKRAEGSGKPPASKEARLLIQRALEDAGVIFVSENGEGPGVRLKKATVSASKFDR